MIELVIRWSYQRAYKLYKSDGYWILVVKSHKEISEKTDELKQKDFLNINDRFYLSEDQLAELLLEYQNVI